MARLYRKSLKTLASWCIDRGVFLEKADELRSRFDAERGCDFAKASRLLRVSCNLVNVKGINGDYLLVIGIEWGFNVGF